MSSLRAVVWEDLVGREKSEDGGVSSLLKDPPPHGSCIHLHTHREPNYLLLLFYFFVLMVLTPNIIPRLKILFFALIMFSVFTFDLSSTRAHDPCTLKLYFQALALSVPLI